MDLKLHTYSDEMLEMKQIYKRTDDVCYYYIINNEGRGVGIENLTNKELLCYCGESVKTEFNARMQGDETGKIINRAKELIKLYLKYSKNDNSKFDATKEFFLTQEDIKNLDSNDFHSKMLRELVNPMLSKQIEKVEKIVKEKTGKNKNFDSMSELEKRLKVCEELIEDEKHLETNQIEK